MNSNLNIDTVKLESIITKLENNYNLVKEIFDNLNKKMELCNGTEEMWQGKTQEKVYEAYKELSNQFPEILNELEGYNTFLKTTIENYNSKEKNIDNNINNNSENLDIN
ncbi:MAG: hypothetical protein J6A52_03140 [Bacilli bacterium]|nr:hypothetical protein [Bacilli bacterium]